MEIKEIIVNENWNKEVLILRHGETMSNGLGKYIGQTDEELSLEGIEKAKKLTKTLAFVPDKVFVSPMKRCVQTAEIVFGDKGTDIEEFKEIDFGDFEGKNYQELSFNQDYQKWIDGGGKGAFPNGEATEDFISRCMDGYKKVLSILDDNHIQRAALVVHGGTIMSILSTIYGGDYYDYQVKNCEGYKLFI